MATTTARGLIPPTYKDLAHVDPETGSITFDAEWLNWFLKLTEAINSIVPIPPIPTVPVGSGAAFAFVDGGEGDGDIIPGPQGPIGLTGATGTTGPAGPFFFPNDPETPDLFLVPGNTGATGATGPTGSAGAAGTPGPWLPAEPEQPDYLPGPAGATGATGATGAAGADGAIGFAVGMLVDGTGEPTDFVPIVGPTGAPGSAGATGAQGADGPGTWLLVPDAEPQDFIPITGPTGPQGAQGVQGNPGADGATGATGPIGPGTWVLAPEAEAQDFIPITGPAGATGGTGAQGIQGPAGSNTWLLVPDNEQQDFIPITGPAGATGLTGAQGSVGQALWALSEPAGEGPEQMLGPQLSGSQTLVTPSLVLPFIRGLLDASDPTAGQIKFPATQNPSSNANTLDDYEEGTWVPTITFATPGNLAVTYLSNVADYTKIGRLVQVNFQIVTSAFTFTTASGDFEILGFPFANAQGYPAVGALWWAGITKAGYTNVVAFIDSAVSLAKLKASGSGTGDSTVGATDMPTGGTIVLRGSLSYVGA